MNPTNVAYTESRQITGACTDFSPPPDLSPDGGGQSHARRGSLFPLRRGVRFPDSRSTNLNAEREWRAYLTQRDAHERVVAPPFQRRAGERLAIETRRDSRFLVRQRCAGNRHLGGVLTLAWIILPLDLGAQRHLPGRARAAFRLEVCPAPGVALVFRRDAVILVERATRPRARFRAEEATQRDWLFGQLAHVLHHRSLRNNRPGARIDWQQIERRIHLDAHRAAEALAGKPVHPASSGECDQTPDLSFFKHRRDQQRIAQEKLVLDVGQRRIVWPDVN